MLNYLGLWNKYSTKLIIVISGSCFVVAAFTVLDSCGMVLVIPLYSVSCSVSFYR